MTIKSVSREILIVQQKLDLEEKGERHNSNNNITVISAIVGVSQQCIDDLSTMLSKLGRLLAQEVHGFVHIYVRGCGLDRHGVRKGCV